MSCQVAIVVPYQRHISKTYIYIFAFYILDFTSQKNKSATPLARVSMSSQVAIVVPYQRHISRRSGTQELSRFLTGDNTQVQAATPPEVWRKWTT